VRSSAKDPEGALIAPPFAWASAETVSRQRGSPPFSTGLAMESRLDGHSAGAALHLVRTASWEPAELPPAHAFLTARLQDALEVGFIRDRS